MHSVDRSALLARTQLFKDVREEALLHLAERAQERTFRKGEFLFHAGDEGDWLYVLMEGSVKVLVTSEEGEDMVLSTLHPPEVLGELSLMDGGPRSASIEALETTRTLLLPRRDFLALLHDEPTFLESVLMHLGRLIRKLTEQTSDFVFLDLFGRVAKLLMALADERGEQTGDDIVLDLPLTQSDIAHMVGGSRQTVNQILKSFERKRYVELQGRRIVIKNPQQLRRRAGL